MEHTIVVYSHPFTNENVNFGGVWTRVIDGVVLHISENNQQFIPWTRVHAIQQFFGGGVTASEKHQHSLHVRFSNRIG